jgi:Ca-activated chloride channel homolog
MRPPDGIWKPHTDDPPYNLLPIDQNRTARRAFNMIVRYTEWNEDRHGHGQSTFEKLFDLFQQLLAITGGDAAEALNWLTQLDRRYGLTDDEMGIGDFIEELKRQGYLREDAPGVVQITARTERTLRRRSLEEVFSQLRKGGAGEHKTPHIGQGSERQPETRPFRFGDDVHQLDVTGTLSNAFRRSGVDDFGLEEDDFQVFESDHHTSTSTVLMIDLSHSMVLYGEDRITPARKTAMALVELILTRYPKDTIDIVAFGDDAWEVSVKDLPYLQVGPFHTNTRAGLQRARTLLQRRKNRNKQIFLITDGKPSAQFEPSGRLYKNPPPDPSDPRTLGPSDPRTLGPSDPRTLGPRTPGPPDPRTLGPSDPRTLGPLPPPEAIA